MAHLKTVSDKQKADHWGQYLKCLEKTKCYILDVKTKMSSTGRNHVTLAHRYFSR